MHIVLVDSYDSFTHNIRQAVASAGARVSVLRCDAAPPDMVAAARPDAVILGPGPGRPEDAGHLMELAAHLPGKVPVLGVCLGHQALGAAAGAKVVRTHAIHGHAIPCLHDGRELFEGLPAGVPMTRYHSLVLAPGSLPDSYTVTAWSPTGDIMAMRHRQLPVWGVQFHPESVLNEGHGLALLRNFMRLAAHAAAEHAPMAPLAEARQ